MPVTERPKGIYLPDGSFHRFDAETLSAEFTTHQTAGLDPAEKLQNFAATKFLSQQSTATTISTMHLKNILCQIKPDNAKIFHGRSLSDVSA